jgi:hypothetical protein
MNVRTDHCTKCGKEFSHGDRHTTCQACRRQNRETSREANGNDVAVSVVWDPAPEGAFRPGASFEKWETEIMRRSNAFTPGTVLRTAGGRDVIFEAGRLGKFVKIQTLGGAG